MESETLEELTLSINDGGETNTTTSAATGLLTNNKLEVLHLDQLPRLNNIVWGKKYNHSLHDSAFRNLHLIGIVSCDALKDLAWLVYVENLKTLIVEYCKGIETIIELGDDGLERARGGRVFGRLKVLFIRYLPKLKSICRHALAFPSIETIRIHNCPELKKLPLDSGSNINNTLKQIEVTEKWWNELEWEDETMKSKFLPYFKKQVW